jgi:hypothetical protein
MSVVVGVLFGGRQSRINQLLSLLWHVAAPDCLDDIGFS